MGRTVVADQRLENYIQGVSKSNACTVGLIIGQFNKNKDSAIHMIKTPANDNDTVEDKVKTKKTTTGPTSIETLDIQWVAVHAKQIQRMLPGGFEILGLFVAAPQEDLKHGQSKMRQILFAVQKTLSRNNDYFHNPEAENSSDKILLQITSLSNNLTCRSIDVADQKSAFRPAEWKFTKGDQQYIRLNTSFTINVLLPIPAAAMSDDLEKQVMTYLKPHFDNIWNSIGTVANQMLPDDHLLDTTNYSKKMKKTPPESLSVNLYASTNPSETIPKPSSLHCEAKMLMQGTMACRAFVHKKATWKEAQQAMKTDIINSIISRCELLVEDYLSAEEEQDPKVLYETPVRVFVPIAEGPLCLCDYMFQDECIEDSVERLKELAELDLLIEDIETNCEKVPDEALMKASDSETNKQEASSRVSSSMSLRTTFDKKKTSSNIDSYFVPIVGVMGALLVAVIAIAIYSIWR